MVKLNNQILTSGAKQALRRFYLSKNTAVTSLTSKAFLYPLRKRNAYQSLARINKIDVLYERLYEDNVSGKVTDSFFMELSHKYENEKEELKKKIFNLKIQLDELNKKVFHKEMFLSTIGKFMEMKTITAPLIRELIDHIEVHETEGEGKYKTQRIVIFYRFVGYIEIRKVHSHSL